MTAQLIPFPTRVPQDGCAWTAPDPRDLAVELTAAKIARDLGGLELHQQIVLQHTLEQLAEELERLNDQLRIG